MSQAGVLHGDKTGEQVLGDPQQVDDEDFAWTAIATVRRLRPGMFVALVVGKSMEPADGVSWQHKKDHPQTREP